MVGNSNKEGKSNGYKRVRQNRKKHTAMIFYTIIAISFAIIFSILTGKAWKIRTNQGDVNLNSEALRNPINTGITVAGFLLPIIVGLISYLFLQDNVRIVKEYFLYSSVLLIMISIFFGLWNNYSLATLTKANGEFPITKTENTTFPAFFLFQLTLLFFGILYLGLFSINNISSTKQKSEISITQIYSEYNLVPIYKPHIKINTNKDSLLVYWGKPNKVLKNDSIVELYYISEKSSYTFSIKNDTIININQKLLK